MRGLAALREQGRQDRVAVQHFATGFHPVVHEVGLELRHDRAFDPEVGVAPMIGGIRVAQPHVRDADAADEADLAIDDEQLAVRAVVDAARVVPAQRMVAHDLHAGVLHQTILLAADFVRTLPVEDDAHLDPARARSASAWASWSPAWPFQ